MKVIGHRGAAGLALENSLEGIKAGISAGVDAVEFDIRLTADRNFILCHDASTGRTCNEDLAISEHTLERLQKIQLNNGEHPASLDEAAALCSNTLMIIEAKGGEWAEPLARFLGSQPNLKTYVISFHRDELKLFHELLPYVPVLAIERTNAIDAIQTARQRGFTGVDLNFWLLNPLSYVLAKYHKLDIIVYTVNSRFIAQFLRMLFPKIWITTDVPQYMQFVREYGKRKSRSTKMKSEKNESNV